MAIVACCAKKGLKKAMASGLKELAKTWTARPERGFRDELLAEYHTIKDLRAKGCPWPQIGKAMGKSGEAVRQAWKRLENAIEEERVTPPPQPTAQKSVNRSK